MEGSPVGHEVHCLGWELPGKGGRVGDGERRFVLAVDRVEVGCRRPSWRSSLKYMRIAMP